MKQIYKYKLAEDVTNLSLYEGFIPLHLHEQGGDLHIWIAIDREAQPVIATFIQVPTGGAVPNQSRYLGTAHLCGGRIVSHVFVETGPSK